MAAPLDARLHEDARRYIRECPAFSLMEPSHNAVLLMAAEFTFLNAAEIIFTKDEPANDDLFLLIRGEVIVTNPQALKDVRLISQGVMLGEVAHSTVKKVRTRTVTTTQPSVLLRWNLKSLKANRLATWNAMQPGIGAKAFETLLTDIT